MCSLSIECVLLLQNVFSIRMCSLLRPLAQPHLHSSRRCSFTVECVLYQNVFSTTATRSEGRECVLFLQNVFSYYRMCSLLECVLYYGHSLNLISAPSTPPEGREVEDRQHDVLSFQNVFSYYRMCSLTGRMMCSLAQNVFSYYRMCSLGKFIEQDVMC